ncbi:MAG: MoxR family ATPase [Acidobacteria bacterium]|nr:MoxR family ATPase [Acidobacteriota bacterium]
MKQLETIDTLQAALLDRKYVADRALTTAIFLSLRMQKPLFLEGEAGVGKTEVARVLAELLGRKLIRLQCYEGLDINTAVYEWNYTRQLLHIRFLESGEQAKESDLFGPDFLLKRPLLLAIEPGSQSPPVLLIDELDRADQEFEAFLLEFLSDFQITIPEIGTLRAEHPPHVILTSNRTREIHDALKRRCFYHWINYPDFEKEYQVLMARVPDLPHALARQAVEFVQALRKEDLYKRPGLAETIDWVNALMVLDRQTLDEVHIESTLGALLKYREDLEATRGQRLKTLWGALSSAQAK